MAGLKIAIDGHAGSGKSSAARLLAAAFDLRYIDSGAYYRAIGVAALRSGINLDAESALQSFLDGLRVNIRNFANRQTVEINSENLATAIRTDEGSVAASAIAQIPIVRQYINQLLRRDAESGVVMEGRDIGTVVLPDADLKFFLTASPEVRAQRRAQDENYNKSENDIEKIKKSLEERDIADSTRKADPLKPAEDAIIVDSSKMTLDDVIQFLSEKVRTKIK